MIFGFVCKCEACQKNYPSIYDENLPFGFVSSEIKDVVDAITFNLNEDVENMDQFSSLLQQYSKHYPSGALYDIGWKLRRAMVLKYGNLASQLQVTMSKLRLVFLVILTVCVQSIFFYFILQDTINRS